MIRIPYVYISNLKIYGAKKVNRLVVVHPRSLQYVQHDPEIAEVTIKYVSGQEMTVRDRENPEYIKKMFEEIVYKIKDSSD